MTESEIVNLHLPVVHKLARRYSRMYPEVQFDDLVQEGTLGLLTAVRSFDASRGTTLMTHAWSHIRQRMRREIGTSRDGKLRGVDQTTSLDDTDLYGRPLHEVVEAPGTGRSEAAVELGSLGADLTESEAAMVRLHVLEGLNCNEIREALGLTITRQAVDLRLKAALAKLRGASRSREAKRTELMPRVLKMHRDGTSAYAIAKTLGIGDWRTVARWLHLGSPN